MAVLLLMYRYCLWGWREGYIQVGSAEDRRIQQQHVLGLNMQRMALAIDEALLPAIEKLGKSIRQAVDEMSKLMEVYNRAQRRQTQLLLPKLTASMAALGARRESDRLDSRSRPGRSQAAVPPPQPPRWESGPR